MNKAGINLQDVFLNQVRKDRLAVTVYMTNGFQLKGYVRGFDNFTVVLDSDGKQQLIYKHAISTVSPIKPVNLIFSDNASHQHGQRSSQPAPPPPPPMPPQPGGAPAGVTLTGGGQYVGGGYRN